VSLPLSGIKCPLKMFNKVVLPEPLGPINPTNSPSSISVATQNIEAPINVNNATLFNQGRCLLSRLF
jgi:hypothetical protein